MNTVEAPGHPDDEWRERRRASVPEVRYPADLPITGRVGEIAAAIRDHPVVIVAGETGSGKSTQLPKICLELGRGIDGIIGHTQPRRLAARTVAERVAEELHTPVGGLVGYATRFAARAGEDTLVKVMTDGIVLAEIGRDRDLRRYDTLIVDEAHERSLNVDFLLGYLHQLLPRRPDLKVVITSATIDVARFSAHFGGAPVIEVSGRGHLVELRYRAYADDGPRDRRDQNQAICAAVAELVTEGPGDILVFVSGEREIRDAADALATNSATRELEIVPLYARLSAPEQHRVFEPHDRRRVVLATNVAETSLTVPGVRYVVDTGTARISRYNRQTKVQRLPIEAVSQASANQRAGRCGRVAPGVCIRLYAEEDFAARPEFTEPEILRTSLAAVILQMAALELGEVAVFGFVDPPDGRAVSDGVALLDELGALAPSDGAPRLTELGRRLAQLPLDPRLGRMVLEADRLGCLREVMVIAAALSIQDPRECPPDAAAAADEAHRRFADPGSDFLAYLGLWEYLREQQKALTSNQFRRLCRAEFLHYLRVREWQDIYSQLRRTIASMGMRVGSVPAGDTDAIHQALLTGLLSHVGVRASGGREYEGARGARFALAGAAQGRTRPRWVMAAELVETDRLRARVVAGVQPAWIERAGAHLVTRSHGDPTWDADRGAAVADERVTMYGLALVTGRRVDYGRVDPPVARSLFILHALVRGEWRTTHGFAADNHRRVEAVVALEDRSRRRDLLVDEVTLYEFYDRLVGEAVVSARHFDSWWKAEQVTDPRLLDFPPGLLLRPEASDVDPAGYPDCWIQQGHRLRLSYVLSPGEGDDGVTVHVPLVLLGRVSGGGFDWHVPGFRREVVAALVRSLPKEHRRELGPAPEYAAAFLDRRGPADGPLVSVLRRDVGAATGRPLAPGSWPTGPLPDHLRIGFRVEDEMGRAIATGKDFDVLRAELTDRVAEAVARSEGAVERSGLLTWSVGTVPRSVELRLGGGGYVTGGEVTVGYPALVDEGDSVALRTLASPDEQEGAMWGGVRRLLLLGAGGQTAALGGRLGRATQMALGLGPYRSAQAVLDACVDCAVDDLLVRLGGPVFDAPAFERLQGAVREELPGAVDPVVRAVARIFVARRRIEERLRAMISVALRPAVEDIGAQLAGLVQTGFITAVGTDRLRDIERYLAAIERRLDTLADSVAKDGARMAAIQRLETDYRDLVQAVPIRGRSHELLQVRWMIEELRVSTFAQTIGTPGPVSEPRIRRVLDQLAVT